MFRPHNNVKKAMELWEHGNSISNQDSTGVLKKSSGTNL